MAALAVAIAGLAGSAAAAAGTPHPGHAARASLLAAQAGPAGKTADHGAEQGVCANCSPPVLYRTGNPVMGTGNSSGTVTVRNVVWAPNGSSSFTGTDPSYFSTLGNFYQDITKASGSTSNSFGIMTEYFQTLFGVTTNVKYSLATGTGFLDTNPYPATGQCTPQNGPANDPLQNNYTACLTKAQVEAELSSQISAKGLPTGLDNLYMVFFPPNVQTQLGTGTSAQYSNINFCGFHSFIKTASSTIVYANEPFPAASSCPAYATPNNDTYGDAELTTYSHEIREAITDPLLNAWFDSSGNEISDECNYNFGPAVGTVATANNGNQAYNQVINGDKYYIQTEFSNAAYAATGVGTGCRQTPFVPGGARPRHVHHDQAGMTTRLTVDGSPTSLPADGSSTSTITITANDANGDPVAGDPVIVSTRDDNATPGGCGTLSTGLPGPGTVQTTDANGQVSLTYTASSISSDCYVLATDVNAGITDQALLYQGSEQSTAPVITESTLPASLVSGGPSATFTATASNPSSSAIHDARFGIYITGDGNGTTGLNASQLTLSYMDEATHGDFINVPLSGTTAGDGQITGLVSTDTAEALAAGATRHATFQLDLAGNAADTATTGANLHIQIALDQIDPADGSLTNLDQTTPGDVPVVQEPGHTITYAGKLVTTSPPSGSTPGTAILEAKDCHFTSDNAACRLTGTATFTAAGGTLSGTITTDPVPGVPDLVITFTETFTTSQGGGTGTGTAQVIYFANGNSSTQNLSASYTTKPDKLNPNIQSEQGTLTITNPTP